MEPSYFVVYCVCLRVVCALVCAAMCVGESGVLVLAAKSDDPDAAQRPPRLQLAKSTLLAFPPTSESLCSLLQNKDQQSAC